VHSFNYFPLLFTASYIRLIGYYDQEKSRFFETSTTFHHTIQNLELCQLSRRKWATFAQNRSIDYSVPVEKDRTTQNLWH